MDEQQLRKLVLDCLGRIAPESDWTTLEPDTSFRDQYEFDSIDCLNLIKAIEKELGITIPEADYPQLGTLNGCLRYLST